MRHNRATNYHFRNKLDCELATASESLWGTSNTSFALDTSANPILFYSAIFY